MTLTREGSPVHIDDLTDGVAVARTKRLCKVYGTGDAQVVALDDVTVGIRDRLSHRAEQLSGGQQQPSPPLSCSHLATVFAANPSDGSPDG